MNQVNPLHIGGLLLVVIMFLFFTLSGAKEDLVSAKADFRGSEALAVDLNALKTVYADKEKTKKSIEKILAQKSIKTASLNVKRKKNFIKISTKSIDTKTLNFLMGKVLNGSYNISLLKIKKLTQKTASFEMEIKW